MQRLRAFHEQAETLRGYCTLLDDLESFRKTLGGQFAELRDFYNRMLNANLEIPALRTFLDGWRVVAREGTITEAPRWQDLEAAYRAAQQALAEQAAIWREQAEAGLAELEASLPDSLCAAGAPDDKRDEECALLAQRFAYARGRLSAAATDPVAAQGALMALQALKLELPGALRELKEKYKPQPADNELHLSWRDLLGSARIKGSEDLEALIGSLRRQVEPLLREENVVVIE